MALGTPGAYAHTGTIVSSTAVKVGPYTMDVLFYSAPEVGQPIPITIAPHPVTSDGQVLNTRPQLQATLQPSPGMSAREIRLRVYDDPDQPAFYAVDPVVDEAGIWVLQLTVAGEAGTATGSTKVIVAGAGGAAQAPAPRPDTPTATATATQGPNLGLLAGIVVGAGLLAIGGWWLLRRPALRNQAPVRRRR
jgi:hypothetical protein